MSWNFGRLFFTCLLGLGLGSCAHRFAGARVPQSTQSVCLDAAEKVLELPPYRERLRLMETLARHDRFDAFQGLAEARTGNPILWLQVSRALRKMESTGLFESELEDLVDRLYRLAHPTRYWGRGSYDSIRKEYLVGEVSRRLLKEDLAQVFKDIGILRDRNGVERFRQIYRRYSSSYNVFVSTIATTSALVHGIPYVSFPDFDLLRHIKIPDELREKILLKGLDAAYPEIERLFGKTGKFQWAWEEFSRYGTYLAYASLATYASIKAREGYLEAKAKSMQAIEDDLEGEKITERSERVKKQLEDWRFKYREHHGGRDPSPQEEEDYARVLRFYGGRGLN